MLLEIFEMSIIATHLRLSEMVDVGYGWVSYMQFSRFEGSMAAGGAAKVDISFRSVTVQIVQTQNCQNS